MPSVLVDYSLQFCARFETSTRYYILRCSRDLFGNLVVSRHWGSKLSRLGGQRHEPQPSLEAALRLIGKLIRIRDRRGYRAVSQSKTKED